MDMKTYTIDELIPILHVANRQGVYRFLHKRMSGMFTRKGSRKGILVSEERLREVLNGNTDANQ